MYWNVFFGIAVVLIAAAIAAAAVIGKKAHMRTNRVITPYNVVLAGVFLATLILLLPVYYSVCEGAQGRVLKTALFALHAAFQVFTIDADTSVILENISGDIGGIAPVYSAVVSVLYVVAPILTFGFLISFFKNASAYCQFFLQRRKDLYVFSELNERSLTLAADIKKEHPKCAFVFTDVFENNEEESYERIGRAKELGAICFKKDILAVDLKIHTSGKMHLFAIGTDESENIVQALRLIRKYGETKDSYLYVFTTRIESELLLSHNQGLPMKVRRINEVQSLINRVLDERGIQLFEHALPDGNGEKKIHAVIAGLGAHGTEMLKALTWYCQMDGYHIEIDAFDKDELAEERLCALCPELMSEVYNGVSAAGEAEYTIRIHAGTDVETKTFADAIAAMKDVTYAFVALGSDENNVKTAVELRMLFERSGIKPVIHAVVLNSDEKNALTGITNYSGQPYDIGCIGDLASSFSESVIIGSELEKEALRCHLKWGREEEFWQYEYNYRSSVASAIHMKARIACGIPGAAKAEAELTPEEAETVSSLEHRRWNAYMRAEGYVYSGSKDKSSRNNLAKMHHDLVDFSTLSDEEKRKDRLVGSK